MGNARLCQETATGDEAERLRSATAATNTSRPLKALRNHCLQCCNGAASEVSHCPARSCPLWLFRFGRNPGAKMLSELCDQHVYPLEDATIAADFQRDATRIKAIQRRCLDCSGGSKADVRNCERVVLSGQAPLHLRVQRPRLAAVAWRSAGAHQRVRLGSASRLEDAGSAPTWHAAPEGSRQTAPCSHRRGAIELAGVLGSGNSRSLSPAAYIEGSAPPSKQRSCARLRLGTSENSLGIRRDRRSTKGERTIYRPRRGAW